jgi:hypothetical protein
MWVEIVAVYVFYLGSFMGKGFNLIESTDLILIVDFV